MKLNVQANDLRRQLFELLRRFKDLEVRSGGNKDVAVATMNLVCVYDGLGDVFMDALRDPEDQQYTTELN